MTFKNSTYGSIKNQTYGSQKSLFYNISPVSFNGTMRLGVQQFLNYNYTTQLGVYGNDMVAVTNATSASNPTLPTLILHGATAYANAATMPSGDISQVQCYVSFSCQNVVTPDTTKPPHPSWSSISMDEVIKWNVDINNDGGTWSTDTIVDYGSYGDPIKIFGISGAITDKGWAYSSSPSLNLNSGILGVRSANRELAFLLYGNPQYSTNTVNQWVSYPNPQDIKTHADCARLIANLAGLNVHWGIRDYMYFNWQPQASMTAIQALSALASEVGGVLRWNGDNNYTVMYPNQSRGLWVVPDCCLVVAVQRKCKLDLNSGVYNPGVYMMPQLGTYNAGTGSIYFATGTGGTSSTGSLASAPSTNSAFKVGGQGSAAQEQPTAKYSSRTIMTSSSPQEYVELDWDTANIYVQNVTVSDLSGPYTTTDPNQWAVLGTFNNLAQFITVNGQVKPVLYLQPGWFPSGNNDATNGNWYLRVGTTKTPAPLTQVTDTATSTIARNLMKYKWIPVCTGSITCAFFGSIPMTGMTVVCNYNGKQISAIIESVSFSSPGIITVNFVNWGELNFYAQLGNSDNLQAINGIPTAP